MKIGFYGAGKAGRSIALYLKNCGFHITGFYSRDPAKSKIASDLVGVTNYFYVEKLIKESDIIFLSVSDDAIEEVSKSLRIYETEDKIFAHLSGSLCFDSIKLLCKGRFSIHPIQTLIGEMEDVEKLKSSIFTIEGDNVGVEIAKVLLERCGNQFKVIKTEEKPLYHYALTLVSNYITTLMDYGNFILKDIGFDEKTIKEIFSTLTINSVKNYINNNEDPLTGPASRGDIKTLKKHFENIDNDDDKKLFLNLIMLVIKYLKKRQKEDIVTILEKFIKNYEK